MHPATELILARMESNPEEFEVGLNGRWGSILTRLSDSLPEEEWDIVKDRLKVLRLDNIHKQIMQELCAPEQMKFEYNTTRPDVLTAASMTAQATAMLAKSFK